MSIPEDRTLRVLYRQTFVTQGALAVSLKPPPPKYNKNSSWGYSSVGIATGYGLEFESRWGKKFSFLHIVQTGSGVHPTSYKIGTGGSFPGVKRQGREADHSLPTSAEVKKMWIYTSTPPYVFMA
jgi:hypothetical protein